MREEQFFLLQENATRRPLESMMLLALLLGLRRDEIRQLRWSNIDLGHQEMIIANSKTQTLRHILLPAFLVERRKEHRRDQQQQRDVPLHQDDLVFPDKNGNEMSTLHVLQAWYIYFEEDGLPRVPFHSLRAYARYRLLQEHMSHKENGKLHRDGEESDYDNI